jgi:hypothetical protein
MLTMMKRICALSSLLLSFGAAWAADAPKAEIGNGEIQAKLYLPDANQGYYRGTRFDWSGVLYSLQFKGHNYYGPWFQKTDSAVHDFIYEGSDIVAGPCSAISGPVDEFAALGWDDAKPGGNFVKIGIGALRKDDGKYDHYKLYPVADPGKWTIQKHPDSIDFIQELSGSGYDYVYRKTVRLVPGKPQMVLEHSLRNRGTQTIRTNVYNHNFLVLDNQPTGPGLTISVPFQIESSHPPNKTLAEIKGDKIVYLSTLKDHDVVATPIEGFGSSVKDSVIRIENSRLGAGMKIEGDRPLLRASLWSIRTVMAVEPFVDIVVEPGAEFTWQSVYEYYTVPASVASLGNAER